MNDEIRETLERFGIRDDAESPVATAPRRAPRVVADADPSACVRGFYFCNGAGTPKACQYCRTADLHDCLVMPGCNLSLLGEKGHAALKGGQVWRDWKREHCTYHDHNDDRNG